MSDSSASEGGAAAGRDIGRSNAITGDHNDTMNVNIDLDTLPTSEHERRQWQMRQIAELRYALLGDDRYGVSGMVTSVRNLWKWQIIMMVVLGLLVLLMLWQQFQIQQIFQQLSGLTRIP